LLFGLAEVTRPLGLPIALVCWGWAVIRGPRWLWLLCVPAGFALGVAPFALRDLLTLGHVALFSVGGAEAFHDRGLGQALSQLGIDPYAIGPGGAVLAGVRQPGAFVGAILEALPDRFITLFLTGGWAPIGEPVWQWLGGLGVLARACVWLLALVGLSRLLFVRQALETWLLLGVVLAVLVPTVLLGLPLIRYRAPADAVFLIWMVAALTRVHWKPHAP
jgi:hypothetical protein